MKDTIIAIILVIIIAYTFLRKDKVIKDYTFVGGLPDTVEIRDTVRIPQLYKVSITKFDTIVIDSTGKIDYNAITSSWERFDLKVDTNIACIGKVRLHASNYELDSVNIYYPKVIIKQVDTIKINELINKNFYENEWFWVSVGVTAFTIISKL